MKTVTWGMIGCGSVTEVKNGPGLYKAERSSLRGVYSRRVEKARDYAASHGVPVVYGTIQELLQDPAIDAVYIATPPDSHREYALACIDAGKIPYIEKPMALNYEECAEILNAAEQKNLPVYVAFYRRGAEKFLKIKELLEEGAIGTVLFAEIRQIQPPNPEDLDRDNLPWRLLPRQGGGHFLDMGVHMLDYLSLYFGDIVEMSGTVENRGGLYQVEDTVSASFRFTNGVSGNGLWCYVTDYRQDMVTIAGTEGRLEFATLDCGGELRLIRGGETTRYDFMQPEHVGQPMIQSIVDELTGIGKSHADARCAANNLKMIDRLLADYRGRYL